MLDVDYKQNCIYRCVPIDVKEVVKKLQSSADSSSVRDIALITYSLENLNHSKKTLFGYALKGRANQKGFLQNLGGEPIGRNSVLLPYENLEDIKEFFATWQVKYEVRRFIEIK